MNKIVFFALLLASISSFAIDGETSRNLISENNKEYFLDCSLGSISFRDLDNGIEYFGKGRFNVSNSNDAPLSSHSLFKSKSYRVEIRSLEDKLFVEYGRVYNLDGHENETYEIIGSADFSLTEGNNVSVWFQDSLNSVRISSCKINSVAL